MTIENKRENFRIRLNVPLSAQLKIVGLNNKAVATKFTKIFIVDISVGGARIHSKLNLPVSDSLLLEFTFMIFNNEIKLLGTTVRKKINLDNLVIEYGIRFHLDESEKKSFLSTLNLLSIRLKHTNIISNCSFCTEEDVKNFYKKN